MIRWRIVFARAALISADEGVEELIPIKLKKYFLLLFLANLQVETQQITLTGTIVYECSALALVALSNCQNQTTLV